MFHLPFRVAEAFFPARQLPELENTPQTSYELGEYYGHPITETESLQHPIEEFLRELGVNIAANCPNQFGNKQRDTLAWALWYTQQDEDWRYGDVDEELEERF